MLLIWVIFAVLTMAAVMAVVWPLTRAPATTDTRELDVAFYQAQAAEIDRDEARGVIGAGEAAVARNEAARRLMAAGRAVAADIGTGSPRAARWTALASVVLLPLVAIALYMHVGAPTLADAPLEARLNADPAKMDMATIMAKLEHKVAANPNDGRGWALLARLYSRLGRPEESANAYAQEIRLLGPSEERLSAVGEDQTVLANGHVTPEAQKNFEAAVKLDPRSPRARFYLGLAAEQAGDKAKAVSAWQAIVADGPADAPWLPAVRSRIAAVTGAPDVTPPAGPPVAAAKPAPGSTPVSAMPQDQQAMIHGMVDRLADRLKSNGNDIEGWLRLVRAYRVLDEGGKAKTALADARKTFASDPGAEKRLDDLAHELGLES